MKLVAAVLLTPLIYAGHSLVERQLGLTAVKLDEQGNAIV